MARKVRQIRRKGKQVGMTAGAGDDGTGHRHARGVDPGVDSRGPRASAGRAEAGSDVAGGRAVCPRGRQPGHVRWTRQRGSMYLADQKLPIEVPRVRDQHRRQEVPLPTYQRLQQPRARTRACCIRCSGDWPRASMPGAPRPCRRRSG